MTMISRDSRLSSFRLVPVAAIFIFAPLLYAAQVAPASGRRPLVASATAASTPSQSDADRSAAYYHYGLAHIYEEMAVSAGRQDYATQAVEELKLALNADPDSAMLQDALADLYFRIGRIKDAVAAAQDQIKRNPTDVDAHMLLGQVYLRSLNDTQSADSGQMLQLAITEYETIARLKPDDLESRLLLGQLYALNHDSAKAEAELKDAQKIDSNSEDVVLAMARLYEQNGDIQRALDTLAAVPHDDRSARLEFALGAAYEQLKKPKEAAAAYRRSLGLEPDTLETQHALANALLADDQLAEALKVYTALVAADPSDAESQVRIADIERRQGHYDQALATLEKAKTQAPDSAELSFNEALTYDALGKFDQAISVLTGVLDSSIHADGKYTDADKQNRSIFLNRLAVVYREQDKTAEAVTAYQQIVGLAGDCASTNSAAEPAHPCYARDGYQGEVDAYRDAHQWKDALAAAADAAKALPADHQTQLMYAQQLADAGQVDQALALARAQLNGTIEDRDVEEGLSSIYIRLKRFAEASAQLDKASATATKPDEKLYVLFLRGELYDREKLHDQAEGEFRQALAIDPQNAEVLNYLGYMLADLGQKLPEAQTMIAKAVELDPQNGAFLDSLGWVYFKQGQYQPAEDNLRKANERMNSDPTVHDHLGEVYEKTGKLKMAVAQWERSLTEYSHSLPADADPDDVQKVQRKLDNARVKLAKLTPAADKAAH